MATKEIDFSQRFENTVNAFIAGGLTGGAVGGATAPLRRPTEAPPPSDVETAAVEVEAPIDDVSASVEAAAEVAQEEEQTGRAEQDSLDAPPATPSVSPVVDPERVIDDSGFSLAADKQRSVFRVDARNPDGHIREVVVVTMPDGSSKAFYNSSGTTDPSAGTAGQWIPFEGFSTDVRLRESDSIGDNPFTYSILAKTFWNKSGYEGTVGPFPGTQWRYRSKCRCFENKGWYST